eukprot:CAMPEP_0118720472 /NCGR_PEP_ID=MMETSP0800-20121206/30127_1 /TAXON_ID=210618 ORGANISM="Striatella unipunctata, Strain CCMP2910" /NCGR_SAMPLE_ID=MMETSP0800 /ASSEMBLY_ACC=CAM_ASM_000638 /LENGTH=173 /DNA_ID=CAMNT_0006628111 /DNA_START=145 /DNA_END=666 /DNA_ORIENTATION=+
MIQKKLRDHDDDKPDFFGGYEKAIKCGGAGEKSENAFKKCQGGEKMGFASTTPPDEMVKQMAQGMETHMYEGYLPTMEHFMPSQDDMVQLESLDKVHQELLKEGEEKVVEFGGYSKLQWGCKVTYGKKDDKYYKMSECGIKSEEAEGKPDEDADDDTDGDTDDIMALMVRERL